MRIVGHRNAKLSKIVATETDSPSFESVTQRFLSLPKRNQIKCPSCGNVIDFNMGVEWHGPDTFSCSVCDRFLSMQLVHRALRDLGIEK